MELSDEEPMDYELGGNLVDEEPMLPHEMEVVLECEDVDSSSNSGPKPGMKLKRKDFSASQKAVLNSMFCSGMNGVGKKHAVSIARAAAETGLTHEQVKVCIRRLLLSCYAPMLARFLSMNGDLGVLYKELARYFKQLAILSLEPLPCWYWLLW